MPAVVVSPIVAVLEQADLPALDPGDRAGTAGVAVSLVEAFERVPDPRQARGIRHGLVPLLVLAACAVMTGARSFAAIGEYARDKGRLVLDTLGADGAVAHSATIRRVLVDVDPAGLQEQHRDHHNGERLDGGQGGEDCGEPAGGKARQTHEHRRAFRRTVKWRTGSEAPAHQRGSGLVDGLVDALVAQPHARPGSCR